jgi:hypothetical protein
MRLINASRLTCAGLALAVLAAAAQAAPPVITRSVISGGGRRSSAGPFTITGTIGQGLAGPTTGSMVGGVFAHKAGFWPGNGPIQCISDYDLNGEVDILDFLNFIEDFSVCELQPVPCGSLGDPDINGDNFIDILDFLDFIDAFSDGC